MNLINSRTKKILLAALREDAAFHDVTTRALVPKNLKAKAELLAKQELVVCGLPLAREVFTLMDAKIKFRVKYKEGSLVKRGAVLAELSGSARTLLSAERVALNFLQRLSGIATLTRRYVEAVKGTRAKILDTRKTTPGLRSLERYAVRVGGGVNHRFDLAEAAMVKDNHWAVMGSAGAALRRLRPFSRGKKIIVEAKSLRELEEALAAGAGHILLDNMTVSRLKAAVRRARGRAVLEASGGVRLQNIRSIAATGVDFISIGALTHSAPAVDISLEIYEANRCRPRL